MALVSVMVDSREPLWIQGLRFGGVPVMTTLLDAGDVLAACDDGALLAIERKEVNDLVNTLRDDRLFPQLARLRALTPWAYLAICGQLQPGPAGKTFVNGRETSWDWAAIQGALLTAQETGVHVLQVAGDHDFEQAVVRLANRSRKPVPIQPARDTAMLSEGEIVLASLPGIGPDRAQAIMLELRQPFLALSYLTTPEPHWAGVPVPGIGDGIKRRVRKALGLAGLDDGLYLEIGTLAERSNGT